MGRRVWLHVTYFRHFHWLSLEAVQFAAKLKFMDMAELSCSVPIAVQQSEFLDYRTLIVLKQHADVQQSATCSSQQLLSQWIRSLYPLLSVKRPGRFYQTVERIAQPTVGPRALQGDRLKNYLERKWIQQDTRVDIHKGRFKFKLIN